MTHYPAPPLPATVDLRDFEYMPLHVGRLRDSETAVRTNGDEFRCAVLLWCASWHQIPAGSLPDDDVVLSDLAGFGRAVKEWRRVRTGALRGFAKHSDGRLYHGVVAAVALGSWIAKLEQRWKTECARLKKAAQRAKKEPELPTFELWITANVPETLPYLSQGQRAAVPGDEHHRPGDRQPMSRGHAPDVPRKSAPSEVKGSEVPSTNRFPEDRSIPASDEPEAAARINPNPELLARMVDECRRAKVADATAENPVIRRWASSGATRGQLEIAIAEARKSKPAPHHLPAGYVDVILTRIVDDDAKARAAAQARVDETSRRLEEQRRQVAAPAPTGFFDNKAATA